MDWLDGSMGRTRTDSAASTRRWVTHARHDGPGPHREVDRPSNDGARRRVGGRAVTASESSSDLVTLDGSSGEGGGQILRTALTLSLLTGRPFWIARIRANRSKPGLRPQHLKAVEAAASLCGAELLGASVGSRELTFRPGTFDPRDLSVDIGTAGSTALVLQALHLPLALRAEGPVRLTFRGGTYNESAPSFPFLAETWRAHLRAIGLPIALAMPSAGYYPEGGGQLEAWIEPGSPSPLILEDRGELVRIRGRAEVTNLSPSIARRMAAHAVETLEARGYEAEVESVEVAGPGQGASIALVAEFAQGPPATFVGLGKRGKPAEDIANDAVGELLGHLEARGGAVDRHSADQLLLPLAFAEGRSIYTVAEVTRHLETNVETIGAFLDRPIRLEHFAKGPGGRVVIG